MRPRCCCCLLVMLFLVYIFQQSDWSITPAPLFWMVADVNEGWKFHGFVCLRWETEVSKSKSNIFWVKSKYKIDNSLFIGINKNGRSKFCWLITLIIIRNSLLTIKTIGFWLNKSFNRLKLLRIIVTYEGVKGNFFNSNTPRAETFLGQNSLYA